MDKSNNFSKKISNFLFQKKVAFAVALLVIMVSSIFLVINFNKELSKKTITNRSSGEKSLEMNIAFLDIGQGDATLFTFPNKEQMLVDCGKDSRVLAALGRVMPFYDDTIDYLAITHPDIDHYGGCVDVMKRFHIKNIIYNGLNKEHDKFWLYFTATIEELRNKGVNYFEINKQMSVNIGGAQINFIYPDHAIKETPFVPGMTKKNDNNTSLVFTVKYGDNKVLMTGDMEAELEKYLLTKYPSQLLANILKVGHHGSDSSSSKEFLEDVSPQYATISVGKENTFGHPSRRTLRKLERINAQTLRTDEKSDILFRITSSTINLEN